MVDLNNSLHILQQSIFFVAKNPAILAGFAVAHFSLVKRRPNLMVDLILPNLNILNGHRSVNPFFFGWQQLPPFLLCWILYQSSDYSIVFWIIIMYRRLLALGSPHHTSQSKRMASVPIFRNVANFDRPRARLPPIGDGDGNFMGFNRDRMGWGSWKLYLLLDV